jgi:beta-glucosidase
LEPGQLKAFQIVRPEPGEIREVDMEIPLDDPAMYDDQYGSRVVRAGTYELQLGVSSADVRLKTAVQIP